MRFFSSLVRPDESTGAVMRWVHRIWVFFWLTVLGAGIGLLSLYLTAHSYASIDATALLQSYFKIPLLVMMNMLAPAHGGRHHGQLHVRNFRARDRRS